MVASEREALKLLRIVRNLAGAGSTMQSEIVSFTVNGLTLNRTSASVFTSECWRYWCVDSRSGAVSWPATVERFDHEYRLVRDGDSWRIADVQRVVRKWNGWREKEEEDKSGRNLP